MIWLVAGLLDTYSTTVDITALYVLSMALREVGGTMKAVAGMSYTCTRHIYPIQQ